MSEQEEVADRKLTEAIAEVCRITGLVPENHHPVDWVVIGVAQSLDPGDDTETMFTCMPGGTMSRYRLVGLLRLHSAHWEREDATPE